MRKGISAFFVVLLIIACSFSSGIANVGEGKWAEKEARKAWKEAEKAKKRAKKEAEHVKKPAEKEAERAQREAEEEKEKAEVAAKQAEESKKDSEELEKKAENAAAEQAEKQEELPDPRLEDRKKQAGIVLWAISGGILLLLFLLYIARTANRAGAVAHKRESEADTLAEEATNKKITANHMSQTESSPVIEAAQTINLEDMESGHISNNVAQPIGNNGRYVVEKELGRGAMGIVFLANDLVLDRAIALKQLPAHLNHEERVVTRFQQEARALARLNHPNIVQVYDFIQTREQCWIAMEYVEGEELEEMLGRMGALHPGEVIQLGVQMADALGYAHEHGVIHRDFKPANVLMTRRRTPKITDFGLAKLAQSSLRTREGTVLGSPVFMSPEQAQGKSSDARTDIYALGVTLFKMMTNRFPFEGDLEAIIAQKLVQVPPPPSRFNGHIPEAFDRIVTQMLAKDPDARPNTMRACADLLRTLEIPSLG